MLTITVLPQGLFPQVLGNFRVVRATKISEGGHNVILSHFKCDHRSICHVLNKRYVLWENALVDIVEFLNYWASQVKEFHSGNLETSIQDRVNDLTSKTLLENVRLDEAQRAVVHNCCRLHRSILGVVSAEPEVTLAFK